VRVVDARTDDVRKHALALEVQRVLVVHDDRVVVPDQDRLVLFDGPRREAARLHAVLLRGDADVAHVGDVLDVAVSLALVLVHLVKRADLHQDARPLLAVLGAIPLAVLAVFNLERACGAH